MEKEEGLDLRARVQYKFIRVNGVAERDSIGVTTEMEGWEFVGMCAYGGGLAILAKRVFVVDESVPAEATLEEMLAREAAVPGPLSDLVGDRPGVLIEDAVHAG